MSKIKSQSDNLKVKNIHENKISSRSKLLLAFLAISALLVAPTACRNNSTTTTTTTVPTGTSAPGAPAVNINLAAKDLKFDTENITVPAGSEVYVLFDNQDAGRSYNFSVYTGADAQTPMFVGDPVAGPGQTTYRFPTGNRPGTYYFRCDLFPINMHGNFIVTAPETASTGTQ